MLGRWLEGRERRPLGHALPQRVETHEALAVAVLSDHLLHRRRQHETDGSRQHVERLSVRDLARRHMQWL